MQCAEFALSSNHFFGSVSVIFVLQACQHWRSALKVTQKEDCMWVDLQCSKTSWWRWCWVLLHKQSTLKCCVVFSRRPKWKKRQDSRPCQGSHLYMYLHFPFHFLLTCTQMFVRLVDCERQTFLTNFFFLLKSWKDFLHQTFLYLRLQEEESDWNIRLPSHLLYGISPSVSCHSILMGRVGSTDMGKIHCAHYYSTALMNNSSLEAFTEQ